MRLPSDGSVITLTSDPIVIDSSDPPAPNIDSLNKLLPPAFQDGGGRMFPVVLGMARAALNLMWARAGIALNAQRSPSFAEGEDLKAWGARVTRPQIVGETEPQYRARLLNPPAIITPAAIKSVVRSLVAEVTPLAPLFLEPALDSAFCAPTTFAVGAPQWSSFQQPTSRRLWAYDESRPGAKYGAYMAPNANAPIFWAIVPEAGDDSLAPHTMPTTSAQIADPIDFLNSAVVNWSTIAPSGAVARDFGASVRMRDGRILLTGGVSTLSGAPLTSAQIYDPSAKTVTTVAAMQAARARHGAALLDSGAVLVFGGHSDAAKTTVLSSCELYDPALNTWTVLAGSMTAPRFDFRHVRLRDRRLLIIGGAFSSGSYGSCELFDPVTGTWSTAGSMSIVRAAGHSATLLRSGRVLVVGATPTSTSADVYTPSPGGAGSWAATASLSTSRRGHTATLSDDGRVFVCGGVSVEASTSTKVVEAWDERTGLWTRLADLATARDGHCAARGHAGIYLIGGETAGTAITGAELYDPTTNTRSALPSLTAARVHAEVFMMAGEEPLVVGGDDGSTPYSGLERLAPTLTAYNFAPTRPTSLLERIVGEVEARRAGGYPWLLMAEPLLGNDA